MSNNFVNLKFKHIGKNLEQSLALKMNNFCDCKSKVDLYSSLFVYKLTPDLLITLYTNVYKAYFIKGDRQGFCFVFYLPFLVRE